MMYSFLKEKKPKGILDKLACINVSNSLSNRLFLKMDLYTLKMDLYNLKLKEEDTFHDHINYLMSWF